MESAGGTCHYCAVAAWPPGPVPGLPLGTQGVPWIHIVTGAAGYVGDRQSGHIPVPHQGPGAPTVWAGGTVGSARWLAGLSGNGGIWRGVVCSAAVGEMKRLCTV